MGTTENKTETEIIELKDFIQTKHGTAMLPHLLKLQMDGDIDIENAYMAKIPNVGTFLVATPTDRILYISRKDTSDEGKASGNRDDLQIDFYLFEYGIFRLLPRGKLEDPLKTTLEIRRISLADAENHASPRDLHLLEEKVISAGKPLPSKEEIYFSERTIANPATRTRLCDLARTCIKSDSLFPMIKDAAMAENSFVTPSREELKAHIFAKRSFAGLEKVAEK